MNRRTSGRRKPSHRSARSSGGSRCPGQERPLGAANTTAGSRRRIARFQPNRRRMRISHEVASSHSTSEFMTTRRSIRPGYRAANARAGWPPMSRPTSEARPRPQASSSARKRSAMWNGVAPPGHGSLLAHAGPVRRDHREAVRQPGGQLRPDLQVLRVAVEQHHGGPVPSRATRRPFPFGSRSRVVCSISEVLAQRVGGQDARDRAEADPLPGVRRAAGQVEPQHVRAAVGEPPGAHQAGVHHRVHAVAMEAEGRAPLRRDPRVEDAGLADLLAPPGFREDPVQVGALAGRPEPLGLGVPHRRDQAGRGPAVPARLRGHDRGQDQEPAELISSRQEEAQVRRPGLTPDGQVGADAPAIAAAAPSSRRRTEGGVSRTRSRYVLTPPALEITASAARNVPLGCLDPPDPAPVADDLADGRAEADLDPRRHGGRLQRAGDRPRCRRPGSRRRRCGSSPARTPGGWAPRRSSGRRRGSRWRPPRSPPGAGPPAPDRPQGPPQERQMPPPPAAEPPDRTGPGDPQERAEPIVDPRHRRTNAS
jgi:hypothetical protein